MSEEFYTRLALIEKSLYETVRLATDTKYDKNLYHIFREAHSLSIFVRDLLDEEDVRRMESSEEVCDDED